MPNRVMKWSLATAYCNLGEAYALNNQNQEAEGALKRALTILEKVHGTDHPDAVRALISLGSLYIKDARHREAE